LRTGRQPAMTKAAGTQALRSHLNPESAGSTSLHPQSLRLRVFSCLPFGHGTCETTM
jgi:hypothetical protein